MVVADFDDNYYVIPDISVTNGAVSDVSVTKEHRDEALTLELNQ